MISTNYRDHLIVALLLGLWLYLFLTLIGPFDAADLSLRVRMLLMIGYGLIFMIVYLSCIPLQNWMYRRWQIWNFGLEAGFLLFFSLVCLPAIFRYYITEMVNGDYGFIRFTFEVYTPILIILLPTVALARRFVARRRITLEAATSATTDQGWLSISGTNKLDILRLKPEQLIAVSAANNYVTIYYQEEGRLQKRLLRSSLKKTHEQLPMLIRAHRSHLIHPLHFRAWKNASTLSLTYVEIPVAQSYKADVTNHLKRV